MRTTTAKKAAKRKVLLQTELNNRGLYSVEQIRDFLIGKTVVTTSRHGGHNYGIGTRLVLDEMALYSTTHVGSIPNPLLGGIGGNSVYYTELRLVANSKEDMKKDLKDLDKRIEQINLDKIELTEKINFLDETESEELDETKFKRWVLKKVLKSDASEEEKINKMAELLFD